MDDLPEEVVVIIAQYLTVRDLVACCATSHAWRYVFGRDIIWKPRCNRALAKCLATAESRVEPKFSSPECPVWNSLSPLGEWRLVYSREHLLWNHWRNGKFITENLAVNSPSRLELTSSGRGLCKFVTDGYLITSHEKQVMLWYVRNSPVYVSDIFHLLLPGGISFYSTLGDYKIVIVQKTVVQVYRYASPINTNWTLEQCFFFDRAEPVSFSKTEETATFPLTIGCFIIENLFVGILSSGEIHVWNLTSGTKLKKVLYPGSIIDEMVKVVNSEKPPKDLVIVVRRNTMYHFQVFSLATLDFYPFNISHDTQNYPSCVIQQGLLAICLTDYFKIFNYQTSQLVLVVPAYYTVGVLTLNDYFLLIAKSTIHLFHTITTAFESVLLGLVDPFQDINGFNHIVCGKFLITDHSSGAIGWEIDLKSTPMTFTNMWYFPSISNFHSVNKSCTKVVENWWDRYVQILSFW